MSQPEPRTPPTDDVTVLSRNTEITGGRLNVGHDLTVRGLVEADVRVGGKVVVAAGARVVGRLQAREAIVAGSIQGELIVAETLTLRSSAVVDGSARAARLIVEEGSSGDVNLRVGDEAFFDLLQRRRVEARAELDRVRAASVSNGNGAQESPRAWTSEVDVATADRATARPRSSDELLASREMQEFLPGEAGSGKVEAAPAGDSDRSPK